MKKFTSLFLILCIGLGFVACGGEQIDPNAIAKVTTGDSSQYVTSVEALLAAVDPSGNSVVTLCKDIAVDTDIKLPYSCTIDFANFTVTTNPKRGLGLVVEAAGGENALTTLKNGTVKSYSDCVRVKGGGIALSEMSLFCNYGNCVSLNAVAKKLDNRVENSQLVSFGGSGFYFGLSDGDYTEVTVTIENSTLYALGKEGAPALYKISSATGGWVNFGQGVKLYSYLNTVASKGLLANGAGLAKKVTSVTVDGTEYANITLWQSDEENEVIDVLMIGNSGCYYFTDELHAVADAAGVQLNVHNIYAAGCTVEQHWTWLQSDSANYEQFWINNEFGRYKQPDMLKLSAALEYEDWDVITLQQSGNPKWVDDLTKLEESCDPFAKNMLDYLKTNHPDAKLYWHETWSWGVGYPAEKEKKTVANVAQQTKQYNNIHTVVQKICEENAVDVIPVGSAWQIARANSKIGDTLTKTDLAHDGDTQGGQYLNACVWFEVLTGKSCIGNTWRPDKYVLDENRILELQKIAHQAVAEMYGADYAK